MLKQSEVANFLDLIKHISQAKDFRNSFRQQKRKKISRYNENESDANSFQGEKKFVGKSIHQNQTYRDETKQTQFDHKMLKITHNIKRKPKSFKFDSRSEDKTLPMTQFQMGGKISKVRSNLYENYCEMIQKKRQQKITRMFRKSQNDISHPIYNISEVVHFENSNATNLKTRETPFIKSKTLNQGLQLIKTKQGIIEKQYEKSGQKKSKKKIQPQQLNIESMRGIKMPKINLSNGNTVEKRVRLKVLKNFSPQTKIGPINKYNNFDGWPLQQEQDKNYFGPDYF